MPVNIKQEAQKAVYSMCLGDGFIKVRENKIAAVKFKRPAWDVLFKKDGSKRGVVVFSVFSNNFRLT